MHDDINRENSFYNMTRENDMKGMQILVQAKIPISRADGIFAEMFKKGVLADGEAPGKEAELPEDQISTRTTTSSLTPNLGRYFLAPQCTLMGAYSRNLSLMVSRFSTSCQRATSRSKPGRKHAPTRSISTTAGLSATKTLPSLRKRCVMPSAGRTAPPLC